MEYPTLNFGRYRGQRLNQVPADYIRWLADPARANATPAANPRGRSPAKPFRPLPADVVSAAREMLIPLDQAAEMEKQAKALLGGTPHESTNPLYVIECEGDCHSKSGSYAIDNTVHDTLDAALAYLSDEFPIEDNEDLGGEVHTGRSGPDPEDDMIVVWEVLPSGHRKAVWAFLGWHWSQDKFACGQGTLPGDAEQLYSLANKD